MWKIENRFDWDKFVDDLCDSGVDHVLNLGISRNGKTFYGFMSVKTNEDNVLVFGEDAIDPSNCKYSYLGMYSRLRDVLDEQPFYVFSDVETSERLEALLEV